jgi:hypothetical protein
LEKPSMRMIRTRRKEESVERSDGRDRSDSGRRAVGRTLLVSLESHGERSASEEIRRKGMIYNKVLDTHIRKPMTLNVSAEIFG